MKTGYETPLLTLASGPEVTTKRDSVSVDELAQDRKREQAALWRRSRLRLVRGAQPSDSHLTVAQVPETPGWPFGRGRSDGAPRGRAYDTGKTSVKARETAAHRRARQRVRHEAVHDGTPLPLTSMTR